MTINFNNEKCYFTFALYVNNNSLAINLMDGEGFPVGRVTTNIPNMSLEKNEILVKNYSGMEGLYDVLVNSNIVHPAHKFYTSEHTNIPICRLTDKFIEWGKSNSTLFNKYMEIE